MAHRVDTLVAMATNRDAAIVADQLAALRWSFTRPFHLVVVDDGGDLGPPGTRADDWTVVRSELPSHKHLSGFKANEGLAWAVAEEVEFRAVLLLDDDALPVGRGVDAWALDVLAAGDCDLVGVGDRSSYVAEHWSRWAAQFARWVPEAAGWVPRAPGLFYAAVWLDAAIVAELAARGLLVPPACTTWDLWPDVWLSWMAEALGFHARAWGTMDVPRPPLYLNHPNHMAGVPPPWLLHPDFALYHSARAVPGLSEAAVRAYYARLRAAAGADARAAAGGLPSSNSAR